MIQTEQVQSAIHYVMIIVGAIIVAAVLLQVNKAVFKNIQKKRTHLHLVFFERLIGVFIVVLCIIIALSLFGGIDSLWKTVLGGTAIISAVLVFAAQDVIKDILAGLMISVHRPFEIGNRIELENGVAGIVKDITMRHVVIHTWDSREMIIPNSRLNSMVIMNDSYKTGTRSCQMFFNIAYGSDVEKAMAVIKQAVMDSEYTIPGKKTKNGKAYGDVYFMAYEANSLQMAITFYYDTNVPTEIVKSDVNLRVNKALKENNIEIPYQYINVINRT